MTSTQYLDRPAAADIAFDVAAYANGMTEDRIGCALEDDRAHRSSVVRNGIGEMAEAHHACRQALQRVFPVPPILLF
jgi:hypothetical protein